MARPKTGAAAFVAFPIRLPEPMLAFVKEEAAEGRRPVNTQIMMFIEEAMERKEARKARASKQRNMAGVV